DRKGRARAGPAARTRTTRTWPQRGRDRRAVGHVQSRPFRTVVADARVVRAQGRPSGHAGQSGPQRPAGVAVQRADPPALPLHQLRQDRGRAEGCDEETHGRTQVARRGGCVRPDVRGGPEHGRVWLRRQYVVGRANKKGAFGRMTTRYLLRVYPSGQPWFGGLRDTPGLGHKAVVDYWPAEGRPAKCICLDCLASWEEGAEWAPPCTAQAV